MRCDSAAMVAKTSELLPDPETPVKTVSRRFGSSTLMSWRLFSRAPCTRIRSWMSATCTPGDGVSVLVVSLIMSPSAVEPPVHLVCRHARRCPASGASRFLICLRSADRLGRRPPLSPDQPVDPRVRDVAVHDAVLPQRPFTHEPE